MNQKVLEIARNLKLVFLDPERSSQDISLFLCGGSSPDQEKLRKEVGTQISNLASKYNYPVYYPEDLFVEQILGHGRQDLLSLENLLATSVHCVVILLQSPGTFAELGAFTNYAGLIDKLIVVIDPKYKLKPSFISMGPVRYLKSKTRSIVLYSKLETSNAGVIARQIAEVARRIAKYSTPVVSLSNPLSSYEFHLSLAYVFDPIPIRSLYATVASLAADEDKDTAATAAQIVVGTLISERKVSSMSGELSITPKGAQSLISSNRTKRQAHLNLSFLSRQRLEALNLTLRKDYRSRSIWGGAARA